MYEKIDFYYAKKVEYDCEEYMEFVNNPVKIFEKYAYE